jgi:AraC-like DNA-binding protein
MPVWLDLSAAAHALHMSVSTLHRNLSQEGTTFQTLKDELRRDIAISRLITTNVSLGALATELGFSDSAAFQRAFKCWTGSPPGEYRRSSERK